MHCASKPHPEQARSPAPKSSCSAGLGETAVSRRRSDRTRARIMNAQFRVIGSDQRRPRGAVAAAPSPRAAAGQRLHHSQPVAITAAKEAGARTLSILLAALVSLVTGGIASSTGPGKSASGWRSAHRVATFFCSSCSRPPVCRCGRRRRRRGVCFRPRGRVVVDRRALGRGFGRSVFDAGRHSLRLVSGAASLAAGADRSDPGGVRRRR